MTLWYLAVTACLTALVFFAAVWQWLMCFEQNGMGVK